MPTIIAVRHFGLGGRESLETAVKECTFILIVNCCFNTECDSITLGVKLVDKKVKQNKAKKALKLIQDLNVQGYLDCILKDVAKELSRIFEFQLFELENDEQVEILEECAVDLMLDLNKNDSFDRNTLIKKVLQDGKISEKKLRTRKGMQQE